MTHTFVRVGMVALFGAVLGVGCSSQIDDENPNEPARTVDDSSSALRRCRPTTCAAQGKNCGTISNGCGGTLTCGTCPAGTECSASNTCVQACSPTSCTGLGKTCGTYADGCGGTLDCGVCPPCSITVTGSFTPSGNSTSNLDANLQAQNPISGLVASGNSLTWRSRNGETGTITISGTTASGTFTSVPEYGLNAVYTPSNSTMGLSANSAYEWITFPNATLSAPSNGFQFLDPIFNNTSFVTSVAGSGDTLMFTDVWGATGTVTLTCKP